MAVFDANGVVCVGTIVESCCGLTRLLGLILLFIISPLVPPLILPIPLIVVLVIGVVVMWVAVLLLRPGVVVACGVIWDFTGLLVATVASSAGVQSRQY